MLPTQAQVIQDATLPNPSIVTGNGVTDVITGGTQAGTNLFHSFQQFSIPAGHTASFQHNPGIANIISRVTGSSASNINGLIEVLQIGSNSSSANLFLINPNGIIFGSGASLNIGGSFVASTASSIKFDGNREFSAINPKANSPLLIVSVPIGLQFEANPSRIVNQSKFTDANGETVGLSVKSGKTLTLVGGEIEILEGGLTASGGRIELGSVASPSLVSLSAGFSLGYEGVENFQNIQLQKALVDATGDAGGNIQLVGKNVTVSDETTIFLGTYSKNGGSIVIKSEQLDVQGSAFIGTDTYGLGTGGDITITTKNFLVQNGSQVAVWTSAQGKGGTLTVNATDSIKLIGTSAKGIASNLGTLSRSEGTGGNVAINTKKMMIQDGATVASASLDSGLGGNMTVTATDLDFSGVNALRPSRASGIFSTASDIGNGGNITVTASRLSLQQGAQVAATTTSSGPGGNVTVKASDSVIAIGTSRSGKAFSASNGDSLSSGLFAQTSGEGRAGQLTIETSRLQVFDGAQINTFTRGDGLAGDLLVRADDVELAGVALSADGQLIPSTIAPVVPSGLFASTRPNSKGNGATLTLETKRLSLRDGAVVQTSTLGSGDAGNLIIKASESVDLTGTAKGGIYPTSIQSLSGGLPGTNYIGFPEATGEGGNVSITTGNLTVRDGAQVAVSSLNPTSNAKGAGNLQIQANNIFLDNKGKLNAETASGDGGDIDLQLQKLLFLRNGSQISTSTGTAEQGGDGGNININAKNGFIVAVPNENSDITANAYSGSGGKINITAAGIYGMVQRTRQDLVRLLKPNNPSEINPNLLSTNDITAISQTNPNFNGDTSVNTPDTEPLDLIPLPVNLVDASQQIATGCTSGNRQARSSFTTIGRSGVAPSPTEPLTEEATLANWIALTPAMGNPLSSMESLQTSNNRHNSFLKNFDSHKIVEAQGWIVDKNNDVILVARAPRVNSSVPLSLSCHAP
ncbi:filamentous hemagglutinin N-terminal domain-containing protein [Scytonema sp. UIC 10036]|uniref:two-partner secretion domain-containing protein n=1 Tax=Scytonema sp. UIC 10036 TaxID=2304196 RepID=UPI00140FB204|nr:filamentous hemagglutinin N-terminal domain-containing protein [Scytonema sp. UIC 10036]